MTSTAKIAAVAQSVAEDLPPGGGKFGATTAASAVVPKVAKLVSVGEARPPGFGKYSSASLSESEVKLLLVKKLLIGSRSTTCTVLSRR